MIIRLTKYLYDGTLSVILKCTAQIDRIGAVQENPENRTVYRAENENEEIFGQIAEALRDREHKNYIDLQVSIHSRTI